MTAEKGYWSVWLKRRIVRPDVDAFIQDITNVCRFHGITIDHEDGHGAFIVSKWNGSSGIEGAHLAADLEHDDAYVRDRYRYAIMTLAMHEGMKVPKYVADAFLNGPERERDFFQANVRDDQISMGASKR